MGNDRLRTDRCIFFQVYTMVGNTGYVSSRMDCCNDYEIDTHSYSIANVIK